MIHLLVIALLAVSTWAHFECPPARKIFPCECFSDSVHCVGLKNFLTVRFHFEGKFPQTIPRLSLTNMQTFSVPSRALGDLSVQSLVLGDSLIRWFEKDAFEGQGLMELLFLDNNFLEDIPTEALQHLNSSLQSLSLDNNLLTRIPDGAFENLDVLMFLSLLFNRISEIDKNAFPKNLNMLIIENNYLSTFNGSLKGLEHLEEIYANDNEIKNISGEFDGLTNLKILSLDRNNISDISDTFLNLTSIIGLSLSGNRIEDVGISLNNLINLTYLDLSDNKIKELHRTFFEKVKDLQNLDLSRNLLKTVCPTRKSSYPQGLRQFLDTHGYNCFRNMKSLRILNLSGNRLVNIDAISLYPLPDLISLHLEYNHLSTLGKGLMNAKNLRELYISFNNFTSLNARYLSHNMKLARFGMEGNPWNCTEETVLMIRELEQRGVAIRGRPDCSTESEMSYSADK